MIISGKLASNLNAAAAIITTCNKFVNFLATIDSTFGNHYTTENWKIAISRVLYVTKWIDS